MSHEFFRAFVVLASLLVATSCKPDKPDPIEAQREAAKKRAEQAKKAVEAPTDQGQKLAGVSADHAKTVVVQIGEQTLTIGDVIAHLEKQPTRVRQRYADPKQMRELVKRLAEIEVLALEAKRQGLTQDPTVAISWKEAMAKALLDKVVADQVSMTSISDAQVKAFYEANPGQFARPERRKGALLVMARKEPLEEARAALAKTIESKPDAAVVLFGDKAKALSIHMETASGRGMLEYVTADGLNEKGQRHLKKEAAEALFALEKVGQMTPPVQLEDKRWGVVMLVDVKPEERKALEEVALQVRTRLFKEQQTKLRRAFVEELVAKADVQIDKDALTALAQKAPTSGSGLKPGKKPRQLPPHLRAGARNALGGTKAATERAPIREAPPMDMDTEEIREVVEEEKRKIRERRAKLEEEKKAQEALQMDKAPPKSEDEGAPK